MNSVKSNAEYRMTRKAKPTALSTQHSALSLSVQYATKPDEVPTRAQFRRWVKAALRQDAEIALRIVDAYAARRAETEARGS